MHQQQNHKTWLKRTTSHPRRHMVSSAFKLNLLVFPNITQMVTFRLSSWLCGWRLSKAQISAPGQNQLAASTATTLLYCVQVLQCWQLHSSTQRHNTFPSWVIISRDLHSTRTKLAAVSTWHNLYRDFHQQTKTFKFCLKRILTSQPRDDIYMPEYSITHILCTSRLTS